MKAISKRKHRALLAALQQLVELTADHGACRSDIGSIQKGMLAISDIYGRYEQLLTELAGTIEDYEKLHHHLRVSVVFPRIRELRKQAKFASKELPFPENLRLAIIN